jgi:hypothetical protein
LATKKQIQKNEILESKILAAIFSEPGRCKSQYCRIVNGHGNQDGVKTDQECFCKNFSCYGNAWKRKGGRLVPSKCKYKKPSVWRKLKNLAAQGLITIKKEKVKDKWISRGWDWMKVCRPIINHGV